MQGPNNILGGGYIGASVGITVEGADILTPTLMIFGQCATRCHPYALKTLNAIEKDDIPAFRSAILGWLGHSGMNVLHLLGRTLTRGWTVRSPVNGETAQYLRKLGWAASRFAFLTDMAMFLISGKLKQRGKLSGRFSDALSWMLFGLTTLRRFEAEGRKAEDLPIVHWPLRYCLQQIQASLRGYLRELRCTRARLADMLPGPVPVAYQPVVHRPE